MGAASSQLGRRPVPIQQSGGWNWSALKRGGWQVSVLISIAFAALGMYMRLVPALRTRELLLRDHEPHLHTRHAETFAETVRAYPMAARELLLEEWHDDLAWHPTGVSVPHVSPPGLALVATAAHRAAQMLKYGVSLPDVCAVLPPVFAAVSVILLGLIGLEIDGLAVSAAASALLALTPAYVGRSMAGDFGAEAIAMPFALAACLVYLRAMRKGSSASACISAILYSVAAACWYDHYLLAQLVALSTLVQRLLGPPPGRLASVYIPWLGLSCWALLAPSLLSGRRPSLSSVLPLALPLAVALPLPMRGIPTVLGGAIRSLWKDASNGVAAAQQRLLAVFVVVLAVLPAVGFAAWRSSNVFGALTAVQLRRALLFGGGHLLGTDAADVATETVLHSITANKPASWAALFFELHALVLFSPHGLCVACASLPASASSFLAVWALGSAVLAGMALRHTLLLAPVACLLSALSMRRLLERLGWMVAGGAHLGSPQAAGDKAASKHRKGQKKRKEDVVSYLLMGSAALALLLLLVAAAVFAHHSYWTLKVAHGLPNLVQLAVRKDGSIHLLDDRRSAYSWLREHTAQKAVVAAWWDHGFEIANLARRRTLADGSVLVGGAGNVVAIARALLANETSGGEALRQLGADYVLIRFGGVVGDPNDDLAKAQWMGKIAGAPELQGVNNETLLYKLSYFRFGQTTLDGYTGYDRARDAKISTEPLELRSFEEVFTSHNWLVRLYRIRPVEAHPPVVDVQEPVEAEAPVVDVQEPVEAEAPVVDVQDEVGASVN